MSMNYTQGQNGSRGVGETTLTKDTDYTLTATEFKLVLAGKQRSNMCDLGQHICAT